MNDTTSDVVVNVDLADRDVRQRGLVPPERLAASHAVVIGAGAIGRQVAVQLAALGMPRLTLFDHDRASAENWAPKSYWPETRGQLKVEATAGLCRSIPPPIELGRYPRRFVRLDAQELPSSTPAAPVAVFV